MNKSNCLQVLSQLMSKFGVVAILIIASTSLLSAQETRTAQFSANEMIIYEKEGRNVLSGNAQIIREDLTLNAENIETFSTEDENGEQTLSKLIANGNVVAKTANQRIESNSLTYDLIADIAYFEGNVKISQGGNLVEGEKVEMNIKTGIYRVIGPISGTIKGSF